MITRALHEDGQRICRKCKESKPETGEHFYAEGRCDSKGSKKRTYRLLTICKQCHLYAKSYSTKRRREAGRRHRMKNWKKEGRTKVGRELQGHLRYVASGRAAASNRRRWQWSQVLNGTRLWCPWCCRGHTLDRVTCCGVKIGHYNKKLQRVLRVDWSGTTKDGDDRDGRIDRPHHPFWRVEHRAHVLYKPHPRGFRVGVTCDCKSCLAYAARSLVTPNRLSGVGLLTLEAEAVRL